MDPPPTGLVTPATPELYAAEHAAHIAADLGIDPRMATQILLNAITWDGAAATTKDGAECRRDGRLTPTTRLYSAVDQLAAVATAPWPDIRTFIAATLRATGFMTVAGGDVAGW